MAIFGRELVRSSSLQEVLAEFRDLRRLVKDMVLLASGPTLDCYNLHQDAKCIGVNKVFYSNKADLDYLFVQDFIPSAQDDMDAYRGNDIRKYCDRVVMIEYGRIVVNGPTKKVIGEA